MNQATSQNHQAKARSTNSSAVLNSATGNRQSAIS